MYADRVRLIKRRPLLLTYAARYYLGDEQEDGDDDDVQRLLVFRGRDAAADRRRRAVALFVFRGERGRQVEIAFEQFVQNEHHRYF